jgi:molecular chaperone GrpE
MSRPSESDPHELAPPEHEMSDAELDESIAEAMVHSAADVVEELAAEEQSVERRLADAQHQVLLANAELENFRRRMQRENEQQLKYANLHLIRDLLDVIDNLKRATESAESEVTSNSTSNQALLSGVQLVLKQMETVFAKYGCQPIRSLGVPFDPNFHEAISQMPSSQYPAGCVAQEVAVGYLLHDRVVRPSCVIVSTGS